MGFELKTYTVWLLYFLDCRFENRQIHQNPLREYDHNILAQLLLVSELSFPTSFEFRLRDLVVSPEFPKIFYKNWVFENQLL